MLFHAADPEKEGRKQSTMKRKAAELSSSLIVESSSVKSNLQLIWSFLHMVVFLVATTTTTTTTGSTLTVEAASSSSTGRISIQGRFSYSLTTFDPAGKLIQLEHAVKASSLGVPIVAVVVQDGDCEIIDDEENIDAYETTSSSSVNTTTSTTTSLSSRRMVKNSRWKILMAAPQLLPSPLMSDDGTSRFVSVSPQVVIGHTGVAADGRTLIQEAQSIAVQHTYLYDEPIPIGLFLEELSLRMQEYTMKPASRPYATTLIVGFIPPDGNGNGGVSSNNWNSKKPRLFRVDCTGAVEELGDIGLINLKDDKKRVHSCKSTTDYDKEPHLILLEELLPKKTNKVEEGNEKIKLPLRIISCSFCTQDGLDVQRFLKRHRNNKNSNS